LAWLLPRASHAPGQTAAGLCLLFNEAVQRRPPSASISLQRCCAATSLVAIAATFLVASADPGAVAVADAPQSFDSGGGPDRTPLIRFLSPSAFAGRVALSGAAGIRTIPLRRCGPFSTSATGTHRHGIFRRPLALAVFRFFADRRILGQSSLATAALYGSLACRRRLRQVMHRLFVSTIWRRCSATCPGKPCTAWPERGHRQPSDAARTARPGDARGVLPFAALLLPVTFGAFGAPTSPLAVS